MTGSRITFLVSELVNYCYCFVPFPYVNTFPVSSANSKRNALKYYPGPLPTFIRS